MKDALTEIGRILVMGEDKRRETRKGTIGVPRPNLFPNTMQTVHNVIVTCLQTLIHFFPPLRVLPLDVLHRLVVTPHFRTHLALREEVLADRHRLLVAL